MNKIELIKHALLLASHTQKNPEYEELLKQMDGFVVVPKEIPHCMDLKICDACDYKIDVFEAERVYKAMIEAVESKE